jgi:hypothetical protein
MVATLRATSVVASDNDTDGSSDEGSDRSRTWDAASDTSDSEMEDDEDPDVDVSTIMVELASLLSATFSPRNGCGPTTMTAMIAQLVA